MKRLILLMMFCLPIVATAQTDHLAPLIKKYSGQMNCSTVVLSKEMLSHMYSASGIESMQAISVENPKLIPTFKEDLESFLDYYKIVMAVNSDGTDVKIYSVKRTYISKETGLQESIEEFVIVAISEVDGIAIRLTGHNITLSDATSLINI